jgi:cardiolipin synthase
MIIAAVILSWLIGRPVDVKPLTVSKINTAVQIVFAVLVLAVLGFELQAGWLVGVTMAAVAALTLLSIAAYVREWVRHMGSFQA